MFKPNGTITSMVTNFCNDGSVDESALIENIEFQREVGVRSICVLGGTGEAVALDALEREEIMRVAIDNAKGLNVVVGALVGTPSEVAKDIRVASNLGATAAMVMVPPFIRPSEQDIIRFVEELTSFDLPLVFFNSPSRSGVNLSKNFLLKVSHLEGVVGIKESSGDLTFINDMLASVPEEFGLTTGSDELYFPSLAVGASGGILASPAVVPEALVRLDGAVRSRDLTTARRIHQQLAILDGCLYASSHPVPLKMAMDLRNLPGGACRAPFKGIVESHRANLIDAVRSLMSNLSDVVEFDSRYCI